MEPHPHEGITTVVLEFFGLFKPLFSKAEHENLILFILGLLSDTRNKTVAGLARLDALKDHTILSKFLQQRNPGRVFRILREMFFERVDWTKTLYFYLDDTLKEKSGKKVRAEYNYSSTHNKTVLSNCFVIGLAKNNDFSLPFDFAKYFQNAHPFKSKLDLAKTMMRSFLRWTKPGARVVFVFDSWYACKKIVKFIKNANAFFITRLKSNRVIHASKLRGKQSLEAYAATLGRGCFKKVKLANGKSYYAFSEVFSVNKVGVVKVVFTRKRKHARKTVFLATNDLNMSECEVIEQYGERWGIEQFFKELKGEFGFDEYQDVRQLAVSRHITLSFASYSLTALVKRFLEEMRKASLTVKGALEKIRESLCEVKWVLLQRLFRRKIKNAIH